MKKNFVMGVPNSMTNGSVIMEYTLDSVLDPLSDSSKGVAGPYLRYDPIYDAIRNARKEDDQRLSRGVWEIDFKRAEHDRVEQLCIDTLTTTSKDLQILGWLLESRISLYGFSGLNQGFSVLVDFVKRYWEAAYPKDSEHRSRLFEWMDETYKTKLHLLPLTKVQGESKSYTYYDYLNAKSLEKAVKSDPTATASIMQRAQKRGEITVEAFQNYYAQTPKTYIKEITKGLKDFEKALKNLKTFLDEKLQKDAPSFSQTLRAIADIARLTFDPKANEESVETSNAALKSPTPAEAEIIPLLQANNDTEPVQLLLDTTISLESSLSGSLTRAQAYQRLRDLAIAFETVEPHSPTANILKNIAHWETMQLSDILATFTNGGDALSVFMNLIAKSK